jgi:2-polyprenyl-3-methyl-5-hydroxy-6-metoxy-1,4-benzoquinol methylase
MSYTPGNFSNYGETFTTMSRYSVKQRSDILTLFPSDFNPNSILEVGCADGANLKFFADYFNIPNKNIMGLDICQSESSPISDFNFMNISIEEFLEVSENCFDVILLSDVLEHIYNPWQILTKLKSHLNRGGIIAISVPNLQNLHYIRTLLSGDFFYSDTGLMDETHIRFFTLKSIYKYLDQAGYMIIKNHWRPDSSLNELRKKIEGYLSKESKCTLNMGSGNVVIDRTNIDNFFGQQIIISATHA